MSDKNVLAEALGVDAGKAKYAPALIQERVFFDTLAKHGISPSNYEQAQQMLQASAVLEEKKAQFESANDPNNHVLGSILGHSSEQQKQAAAPEEQQYSQQQFAQEVRAKTAAYMQDPEVYANLLVAFGSPNK